MTLNNLTRYRSLLRIAASASVAAVLAASLQYQPSDALPSIATALDTYHASVHDSIVLAQLSQHHALAMPKDVVAMDEAHSLLTTPKLDPTATTENERFEGLSIRTVVRTRRIFTAVVSSVRFTADLRPGTREIIRHAKPGITAITERLTVWNDVIVNRQVISRVVVQQPAEGIIVAGAPRSLAEAMALAGVHKPLAVYTMMATAYTADSAQSVPTGRTATGLPARYGVVAVDPRVIRLGSRLFIAGYGTAVAADTGGDIHGNRIDLCMDSIRSAMTWGRQPVTVYVLQE